MSGPAPAYQVHPVLRAEKLLMHLLTWLLTALFGLIFVLVVILVIMRYGFNTTIIGGSEATVMLFIYTTALGAAVDIARGKHIRIDALIDSLPLRIKSWLEGINLILIGILHAMLLYYSTQWISVVGNSEDPVLHIAEGLIEVAIPIGCAFAILFCITRLIALIMTPLPKPTN
ncbi:TRAP-type C4-dicarboxylate transport system, small permease component [Cohaesibacter marisflavi]|uniref:TRAP transporter small permease protein n=1 Tax=Cohaesibacter marisflavi TaxID=655353 RepID=A0A1I5CG96_9HYPH|nr:TRAP transporter small permease [Cohaesibacter marisflavi]SFN86045.1 TRAP-type C4-dicarboxylate transport system, small permease component [Cohaesibacter marisflavi]